MYIQLAYFPMVLNCIFLNVRGLNSPYKWRVLNKEVHSLHEDVLYLQSTPALLEEFLAYLHH